MEYDPREISIIVRDGLMLLQERERGRPATLIEELEAEATFGLKAVEGIVDGMARQERLWLAHGMNEAIANPNTTIPGNFSRARWAAIKEMFDAFKVWARTPLPGCGVSPITIMSWRGNPPEAPAPSAEQAQGDAPPPDVVIVGEVEDVIVDGKATSKATGKRTKGADGE